MKNLITLVSALLFSITGAKATTILTFGGNGFISQNQNHLLTEAGGYVFTTFGEYYQNRVVFQFTNDTIPGKSEFWYLTASLPQDQKLGIGFYNTIPGIQDYPSLNFSGNGNGSEPSNCWFEIKEIVWGSEKKVTNLALDFYHTIKTGNPSVPNWTQGSLRYNSSIPLGAIPEPGAPLLLMSSILLYWRRRR